MAHQYAQMLESGRYSTVLELAKALKLDPAVMREVDATYGAQTWTHPYAHALYWARAGLEIAASFGRVYHGKGDAVLYRAARVEGFDFCDNVGSGRVHSAYADERGLSDEFGY